MIILDSITTNATANCFGFWIPTKLNHKMPEFIIIQDNVWGTSSYHFKKYYNIYLDI